VNQTKVVSGLLLVIFRASAFWGGAPLDAAEDSLRWLDPAKPPAVVSGLPWFEENAGEWIRLPLRLKDSFRKPVWNLAQSPSGGRIRLRTDSAVLAVRLEYPSPPDMANMHAFGQTGVDLYADGRYLGTAIAPKDAGPGTPVEHKYFDLKDAPRREREIVLYLPLYKAVKVLAIGVDAQARLAPPSPFATAKPAVFYGTSITQSGCASRSGMSYQAILGRRLNIDFVNLGFSGNGIGEPAMASAVAGIDAACFVLDFAQNNRTAENLAQAYDPFIETLRKAHPRTPIVAITPIASSREDWGPAHLEEMRAHIRGVVERRRKTGDRRIELIEGITLLGPDRLDGLVDGTHPNDLGFEWMAEGLRRTLARAMGVKSNP
jgi:lysophospholipase L1-like esterase